MKYYKILYRIGKNSEYIYPPNTKGAIWNLSQYNLNDNVMIGGTDTNIEADGSEVVELSKKEALSQIEEFKKSYPEIQEEELPAFPGIKEEPTPARTAKAKKKGSK